MTENITKLRVSIAADAGASEFVELAELLSEDVESRPEAREICFRGLTADPKNLKGRLVLAQLFYQDKLYEFCVRELVEIERQSDLGSVGRLLDAFGGYAESYRQAAENTESSGSEEGSNTEEAEVMAEIDLEADFVDALDEIDENEQ